MTPFKCKVDESTLRRTQISVSSAVENTEWMTPEPPCNRRYGGCQCLESSVAERQSCKLKVLGSIPSGGFPRALMVCELQFGASDAAWLLRAFVR